MLMTRCVCGFGLAQVMRASSGGKDRQEASDVVNAAIERFRDVTPHDRPAHPLYGCSAGLCSKVVVLHGRELDPQGW
jgi:hypothetical protein